MSIARRRVALADARTAWFYTFGRGQTSLNRHPDGNKQVAVSVRCVRD